MVFHMRDLINIYKKYSVYASLQPQRQLFTVWLNIKRVKKKTAKGLVIFKSYII